MQRHPDAAAEVVDLNLNDEIEVEIAAAELEQAVQPAPGGSSAKFARNALMNIGRLLGSALVALVLPAYLTHRLPLATYAAWVLLLQMGAYVGYLDFGVQTGIAKFVAEYEARGDLKGATERANAGLAIVSMTSLLGILITLILAWKVPSIFAEMPADLYSDVRISLVVIGGSLAFGLLCSVPSAIFLGLQRYGVPMLLGLVNRFLFSVVVVAAVAVRSSLATMGILVAGVNVITGLIQVVAWKRMANRIQLGFSLVKASVLKEMFSYCSVLAIWSAGMLCVNGLDVTIVGHYDFLRTPYYSVATLPTSFIIALVGAALAPLLPAASALSTHRSPQEMGQLITRLTRYCVLLLGVMGVPMIVGGYWVLSMWVGPKYAEASIGYLRILVLANMIRNICLPYSTVLTAIGRQKVAVGGVIGEAIVNLGASILLVQRVGAMGVAYGTLLGSLVCFGMHYGWNMRVTNSQLYIPRRQLFWTGMLRPATMAIPSAMIARYWWTASAPQLGVAIWLVWAASTAALVWMIGLNSGERKQLLHVATKRFSPAG